jgi:Tol biopolymer transport system component
MKTLIMQNAVTGKVDQRIEIKTVDMPESPDISPDGKEVAFSGLEGATGDIFIVNLESREVRRRRTTGDFAPTWSPDGIIVYLAGDATTAVPARSRDRADAAPLARTTTAGRSSSTTTRSSSPRPRSIPTSRSNPKWPATGTSTTSGR